MNTNKNKLPSSILIGIEKPVKLYSSYKKSMNNNGHCTAIGSSGSGKSFFLQYIEYTSRSNHGSC